ncbi:Lipoprotein OS=Streptomyces tendae OX=1932 GN=GUR47_15635 PE=4 SV=1 [Streptomyces tendae]
MNRHFTRIAALTLTATAALTLSACGGDDGSDKGEDKIAETATGSSSSSASPTAPASADPGRPQIELPSDLSYTFDWPRTRDKDKDAVLADGQQSIKAVDLAIFHQDPLDKAYLFYYEGEAAAGTQEFIEAYVKENARVTGAYRFYDAVVNIRSKRDASLIYCEDQGKAYVMYLKPKKVNKTPVTRNSYVLYSTQLRKNDKGVWVVRKMHSQRGSDRCQP